MKTKVPRIRIKQIRLMIILGCAAIFFISRIIVKQYQNGFTAGVVSISSILNSRGTFDTLPQLERDIFVDTRKSNIFLVESSLSENFTRRCFCGVESYCKSNSDSTVWFLVLQPNSPQKVSMEGIWLLQKKYTNLIVARITFSDVLTNTPLKVIEKKKNILNSRFRTINLSAILRLVLVWKYGGFYSDTDVLCFKEVKEVRNTVYLAMFHFDARHPLLSRLLDGVITIVNSNKYKDRLETWGVMDPLMFTKMIGDMCRPLVAVHSGAKIQSTKMDKECSGVSVLNQTYFASFHYDVVHVLYVNNSARVTAKIINGSYGLHLYNKMTHDVNITTGSVIHQLTHRYCPFTAGTYKL